MTAHDLGVRPAASSLLLDFLTWVEREPRSYAEAMEAWHSHCPRFTIWEDALADGLLELARSSRATAGQAQVTLTVRGRAILSGR